VVRRRAEPDTSSSGSSSAAAVFVLQPDVLDRADVLTMASGDPGYDEMISQEFEVSVSGEGKVKVVDKVLRRTIEYSAAV
jgi:hypothetical protein